MDGGQYPCVGTRAARREARGTRRSRWQALSLCSQLTAPLVVMELSVAKVFTHHTAPVNSLDFTKDGERLLSSGDDHRICLYSDARKASIEKLRQDNAHGATLARFTHDPLSIIAASPMDHAIRYISLHDEKILAHLRGPRRRPSAPSLEMSPKEDILVSASMDDTIRLWDLRQTNCQAAVMRFQGGGHRPAVAFDPQGMIFAAAICGGRVKLFDVRACDKGSFLTFTLHELGATSFSGIKFSNDGNHLLVGTTHGAHALVDSFKGNVVHKFSGHKAELGRSRRASAPTRILYCAAATTAASTDGRRARARSCRYCASTSCPSPRSAATRRG